MDVKMGHYMSLVNTEENVKDLTIEEYNTASCVYSAWVRDYAVNTEGVRKGYFEKGLNKGEHRGRKTLLKNTGVRVTVDVLYGPLLDVAESMSETISKGYLNFLVVNNCSSKIRYTNSRQNGWTELCELYFDEYNAMYKICPEGSTWEDYSTKFADTYGVEAYEFGSWDMFYNIFSPYFKLVAEEYMRGLYESLEERRGGEHGS